MDKSTHEEHSPQPLQTNKKQFKNAVAFLTMYNGIFNVTDKKKIDFIKSNTDEHGCIQITIHPGAYELENLKNEIRRVIIDKEYYTEKNYPFIIKPKSSTLESIIEISIQGPITTSLPDDSIGDLLGFNRTTI